MLPQSSEAGLQVVVKGSPQGQEVPLQTRPRAVTASLAATAVLPLPVVAAQVEMGEMYHQHATALAIQVGDRALDDLEVSMKTPCSAPWRSHSRIPTRV